VSERGELGDFLKVRRGRVKPETVGITPFGRRRVSGLRREELAAAAGVSVDYYVRLEQGRASNPSDEVLDAIARVLALDETERVHLHRLGHPDRRPRRASAKDERVRPGLARLLEGLDPMPAYLLGRRLDIIGWTRVGSALVGDFAALPREQRNLARLVFLGADAKELLPDWSEMAYETVGLLRLVAGRNPNDPDVAALVEELSLKRPQFRRWWGEHDVAAMTCGTRRFRHPIVGELTLNYEALSVPSDTNQMLVIYTAEPGTEHAEALELLADTVGGTASPPDSRSLA
jgi:transcriptional regulator with XRE-family HTH domain